MELDGKIILDLGMTQGTSKAGNPWKKHDWVLETFGEWPKKVKFDVFGNRNDIINLEVGQSYTLTVEANSREFNGKWYTDISCFGARPYNQPAPAPQGYPQPGGYPQQGYPQQGYPQAASAPAPAPQPYQQPAPQPFGGSAFPPAPTPGAAPAFDGADSTDDLPF